MKRLCVAVALIGCLLCAGLALGANTLTVESKTVEPGTSGVEVGVYLRNEVALKTVQMAYKIRSLTGGAYIANNFSYAETNRFASFWDLPADVFWPGIDAGPCPFVTRGPFDFVSPDAFVFGATQIFSPNLAPGDDGLPPGGTPSLTMTFDVSAAQGTFEIDTTCAMETFLRDPINNPVSFVFSEGIITVEYPICNDLPCDLDCDGFCTPIDLAIQIDVLFAGLQIEPCCVED